jgi:hypothetical protein
MSIKKYFISMLKRKSNFTLVLSVFIILFSVNAFSSDIKTSRNKPTDILIEYQVFDPLTDQLFSASELPFRTVEKSLFFTIDYVSNFKVVSNLPVEVRDESYKRNSMLGLASFFVFGRFGAGIQLDFSVKKGVSDRTLTHQHNYPTVNYYHVLEKFIRFNIGGWIGYRILDNLGVGFDVFFKTSYSDIDRTYKDLTGFPPTEQYTRYNVTDEKLKISLSVTYKPFSFFRFTFEGFVIHRRMVEAFLYSKNEWVNLGTKLRLVFLPVTDVIFIYTDILFFTDIGRNYDRIVDNSITWTKEKNFKVALIADYWMLPAKLYARLGVFFENKIYDEPTKFYLSRRDELYTFLYGFQIGVGAKLDKAFSISCDFIFNRYKYGKDESSSYDQLEPYNVYRVVLRTKIKF